MSWGNDPDKAVRIAKRIQFEQWKKTEDYIAWRKRQYRIQKRLCAWCQKELSYSPKKAHIDHALPIYHGGTNDKRNLVLAHKRCNRQKWIRIDATPIWIQEATKRREKQELLWEQQKVFRQVVNEELDDQLLAELRGKFC